jgi:hypothetical protein
LKIYSSEITKKYLSASSSPFFRQKIIKASGHAVKPILERQLLFMVTKTEIQPLEGLTTKEVIENDGIYFAGNMSRVRLG